MKRSVRSALLRSSVPRAPGERSGHAAAGAAAPKSRRRAPDAAQALSHATGGKYIDTMLVQHLGAVRNPMARANLVKVIGLRNIQGSFDQILPLLAEMETRMCGVPRGLRWAW